MSADYLKRVRALSCVCLDRSCVGEVQAHHAGRVPGLGLKAADDTAIPLCVYHHQSWHDHSGPFKGMTRELRRKWADYHIALIRRIIARQRKAPRGRVWVLPDDQ